MLHAFLLPCPVPLCVHPHMPLHNNPCGHIPHPNPTTQRSLFTTAGHVGYELSPFIPTLEGVWALLSCGLRGSRGLNTVQHHDLHHRFPSKHFSLYFTHWDRWMGTLHPKYEANLFRYFDPVS